MQSEAEYLKSMKEGSHEAFDYFYRKYSPRVEEFCRVLLKDNAAAEDICQNVFLNLWKRREIADKIQSFNSFLFTMTRNAVFDHIRKKRKNVLDFPESIDLSNIVSADLQTQVDAQDLLLMIEIALSSMPEKRSRIFRMNRIEGMKTSEIAEKESMTQRAVEWNLKKALEELSHIMEAVLALVMLAQ